MVPSAPGSSAHLSHSASLSLISLRETHLGASLCTSLGQKTKQTGENTLFGEGGHLSINSRLPARTQRCKDTTNHLTAHTEVPTRLTAHQNQNHCHCAHLQLRTLRPSKREPKLCSASAKAESGNNPRAFRPPKEQQKTRFCYRHTPPAILKRFSGLRLKTTRVCLSNIKYQIPAVKLNCDFYATTRPCLHSLTVHRRNW